MSNTTARGALIGIQEVVIEVYQQSLEDCGKEVETLAGYLAVPDPCRLDWQETPDSFPRSRRSTGPRARQASQSARLLSRDGTATNRPTWYDEVDHWANASVMGP
jgi:hypothetical protein